MYEKNSLFDRHVKRKMLIRKKNPLSLQICMLYILCVIFHNRRLYLNIKYGFDKLIELLTLSNEMMMMMMARHMKAKIVIFNPHIISERE